MRLPNTVASGRGLTVEGASPELLSELLHAYGEILQRTSPHIWESMVPGLPRDEIEERLGAAGLSVPEELVVWWGWRNGHYPGIGHGLRLAQHPLDFAIQLHEEDAGRDFMFLRSPSWIPISGAGLREAVAVCCDQTDEPPLVKGLHVEYAHSPEVTHAQAVSLCTFVTWQLVAIEEGWNRYDPESGFWKLENWEAFPLEWRLTGIA